MCGPGMEIEELMEMDIEDKLISQGKRMKQIEFSLRMVGLSLLGTLILILGFSVYHIIGSLLH